MSTTVDTRVVQMKFDNKDFEKNVASTQKALKDLDKSLKLEDSAKGFENITKAAQNVDLSSIEQSINNIDNKFSLLGVTVATVMQNMVNSALNAGKQIASALIIEPKTTGFQEYEQLLDSTRVIMSGTGEDLKTVTGYLDELNRYADRTIYSFSDMTQNIGKFTNAGVSLEDSVAAMTGIANAAALAGANSNEASRAMYNLAQSLSMGYVQYIDWKSIENANMATVDFKKHITDVALQLGEIKKVGDDLYDTGKQEVSMMQLFKDGLKDQWLTSEVLITTLKQYGDETTAIGKKAYKAATEVTTFTKMMDTLKEAAQSGWANTWKAFIGDYEQAKEFWTGISNAISGVIEKSAEMRNNFLGDALSSTGAFNRLKVAIEETGIPIEDFENMLIKTGKEFGLNLTDQIAKYGSLQAALEHVNLPAQLIVEVLDRLAGTSTKVSDSIGASTDKLKEYETIVNKVLSGGFGNGEERIRKLTEAGYDYATIQGLVNKVIKEGKFEIDDLNDSELEAMGYTYDQVKALRELAKQAKETGTPINEMVYNIEAMSGKMSGRAMVIEGFKNIIAGLSQVIGIFRDAWNQVFVKDVDKSSSILYGFIKNFYMFTTKLRLGTKEAEDLKNVLTTLFTILKWVTDIVTKIVSIGLNLITKVLTPITDWISKQWKKIEKFVKDSKDIVTELFNDIIDGYNEMKTKIEESDAFKYVSETFEAGKNAIITAMNELKGFLGNLSFSSASDQLVQWMTDFVGFMTTIKDSEFFQSTVGVVVSSFKEFFANIKLPKVDFSGWTDGLRKFFTFLQQNKFDKSPIDMAAGFFAYFKEKFKRQALQNEDGFFSKMADFIAKFVPTWTKLIDGLKAIAIKLKEFLGITGPITVADIYYSIEKLLKLVMLFQATKMFIGAAKAINNFAKAQMLDNLKDVIFSLTAFVAVCASAMVIIANIPQKDAARAFGYLEAIIATLVGISLLMTLAANKLKIDPTKKLDVMSIALTVISLAASLYLIARAVQIIDAMDFKHIQDTMAILVIALAGMVASLIAIAKFGGASVGGTAAAMLSLVLVMEKIPALLQLYSDTPWEQYTKGIKYAIGVLVVLAVFLRLAMGTFSFGRFGTSMNKNLTGVGIAIIAIGVTMKLIAGVINTLGKMPEDQLWRGTSAVGILILAMGATIRLMGVVNKGSNTIKKGYKQVNAYKGIATVLLAMAGSIYLLGNMDPKKLEQGGLAAGAILVALALFMKLTSPFAGKTVKVAPLLIIFAGFALIIAEIGQIIYLFKKYEIDGDQAKKQMEAMSMMLLSMGVTLAILGKFVNTTKTGTTKIAKAIGLLTLVGLVAGAIGGLLVLLSMAKLDGSAAISQVGAISILLGVITGVLLVLDHFTNMTKTNTSKTMRAIGTLALIGLVSAEIGFVLTSMQNVDGVNAIAQATAISILMGVMTGVLIAITKFTNISAKNVLDTGLTIGALAALGLVVAELGAILSIIQEKFPFDGNAAIPQVVAIGVLMLSMAVVLYACSFVGAVAGPAAAGAIELIAFLGVLTGLLDLMGEKFSPDTADNIAKAAEIMTKVGEAIGGFVGGILGGFVGGIADGALSGIASGIESVGEAIGSFWSNAEGFFNAMGGMKEGTGSNIETFGTGIKELLGASLTLRGNMGDLGSDLSAFAENANKFFEVFSSGNKTVDLGFISTVASAIKELSEASLTNTGANTAQIGIGKNESHALQQMAKDLAEFADMIGGEDGYYAKVKDLDTDTIKTKTEKLKSVVALFAEFQNGGILKNIGENWKMNQVTERMSDFAKSLVSYSDEMAKLTQPKLDAIAIGKVASEKIKSTYDVLGLNDSVNIIEAFSGRLNVEAFSGGLKSLAEGIVTYADTMMGMNQRRLDALVIGNLCVEKLKGLKTALGLEDGSSSFLEGIFGDKELSGFGKALTELGEGIAGYATKLTGLPNNPSSWIELGNTCIELLVGGIAQIPTIGVGLNGSSYVTVFADSITNLGKALVDYVDKVKELDSTKVDNSLAALSGIIDVNKKFNDEAGENGFSYFGTALTDISTGILSYFDAINQGAAQVETLTTNLLTPFFAKVTENLPTFKKSGEDSMNAFFQGLTTYSNGKDSMTTTDRLINLMKGLMTAGAMAAKSEEIINLFVGAGKACAQGIVKGLNEAVGDVQAAAAGLATAAQEAFNFTLDINSPSKVFTKSALSIGEGVVKGIKISGKEVRIAASDLADTAREGFAKTISTIADAVDSDMEYNPVIRPVLDLSEIQNGNGLIQNLLGTGTVSLARSAVTTSNPNAGSAITRSDIDRLAEVMKTEGKSVTFTQNNYSPKALSRFDIYRQTKSQISSMERVMQS